MRRTTRTNDADGGDDEPDGDDPTGFGCGVWRARWDGGGGGSVDADIDADGGVTVGKANRRLSRRTNPSTTTTTNLGVDRGRAWMDAVSTLAAADVAAATRARTTTTMETQTTEVVTTACDACERRERALRETEDALRECRAVMAAMTMEPAVCAREVGCAERNSSRRTVWARVRLRKPVVDARGATPGGRARIDERASGGSTVVDGATARRSAVKTVDGGLTKSTSTTPDLDPVAVEEERVKMERMEKRRAERTAIMAKRSRARRAAKAARQAIAPVVSSSDTRDSRTGKPDWNDSVDVDAMPRRKTNEEYFAELDKLVRARRAEEAKERLKEARRKLRRRNRARKAAMEAKHVPAEHASAMEERTSDGDAATTRSSMDSARSFATAEAS